MRGAGNMIAEHPKTSIAIGVGVAALAVVIGGPAIIAGGGGELVIGGGGAAAIEQSVVVAAQAGLAAVGSLVSVQTVLHHNFRAQATDTAERPNGTYEESPKHGGFSRGGPKGEISQRPADGQTALNNSGRIKPTSPRRVGVDPKNNEFVVLDETRQGLFHGHVRSWKDLTDQMRGVLVKMKHADWRGNILRQ